MCVQNIQVIFFSLSTIPRKKNLSPGDILLPINNSKKKNSLQQKSNEAKTVSTPILVHFTYTIVCVCERERERERERVQQSRYIYI